MTLKNLIKKEMKKLRILTLFILFSNLALSQPFTNEIGIDEKLDSILPLDLVFQDEENNPVSLKQLINKPTVLVFVYFDCPGLCSPLQEGVSKVIEASDMELGKDYQVITVSFNFHDTPEKAKLKKSNFVTKIGEEKAASWYYLTGDSASIVKILNSVGYKIKIAGLDYIHPSAIVITSPQGKITRYLYGLTFLPFDFKMALIESQKGLSRPTVNKFLEFCYSYEPAGKRYTLEITKLTGIFIIFVLGIFFLVLIIRKKKKA
jgi:protein SCO1